MPRTPATPGSPASRGTDRVRARPSIEVGAFQSGARARRWRAPTATTSGAIHCSTTRAPRRLTAGTTIVGRRRARAQHLRRVAARVRPRSPRHGSPRGNRRLPRHRVGLFDLVLIERRRGGVEALERRLARLRWLVSSDAGARGTPCPRRGTRGPPCRSPCRRRGRRSNRSALVLTSANDAAGLTSGSRCARSVNGSYLSRRSPRGRISAQASVRKGHSRFAHAASTSANTQSPRRRSCPLPASTRMMVRSRVSPCPHHDYLAHVGCHTRTVAGAVHRRQRSVGVDAALTTLNCRGVDSVLSDGDANRCDEGKFGCLLTEPRTTYARRRPPSRGVATRRFQCADRADSVALPMHSRRVLAYLCLDKAAEE